MGKPISGDGNDDKFSLRRMPNGVYCVDGRIIPVADDAARRVNNGESVVNVSDRSKSRKHLRGSKLGVDVK